MKPFKQTMTVFACLGLTLLTYVSCGDNNINSNAMLSNLSSQVIIPTYRSLSAQAALLEESLEAFCLEPSLTGLESAQQQWRAARSIQKQADAFLWGPYVDQGFQNKIDFWPARTENIEQALIDYESFTPELIGNLGVSVRGLTTLEYLLFGAEVSQEELLNSFQEADSGTQRCNLLQAVGADFVINANDLLAAWNPEQGNYSASLALAGEGSLEYPTTQSAITKLLNQMILSLELMRDIKLGKPMGKANGGEPLPMEIESPFSENSIEDMIDNLKGLKSIYTGRFESNIGLGFRDIVDHQDDYIGGLVVTYIDQAINALEVIPKPLSTAVVLYPEACEAAYIRIEVLHRFMTSSISTLLGITPYFNTNDGD